jgi:hypothetical protein
MPHLDECQQNRQRQDFVMGIDRIVEAVGQISPPRQRTNPFVVLTDEPAHRPTRSSSIKARAASVHALDSTRRSIDDVLPAFARTGSRVQAVATICENRANEGRGATLSASWRRSNKTAWSAANAISRPLGIDRPWGSASHKMGRKAVKKPDDGEHNDIKPAYAAGPVSIKNRAIPRAILRVRPPAAMTVLSTRLSICNPSAPSGARVLISRPEAASSGFS